MRLLARSLKPLHQVQQLQQARKAMFKMHSDSEINPSAAKQPLRFRDGAYKSNIHQAGQHNARAAARQYLLAGEVIALPTDTVYGLACDASNEQAMQKLYAIKGRDSHKPVAICVKSLAALRHYGEAEHLSYALLECLLPGPITIVIQRSMHLRNRFLNPSTNNIGIRIPKCAFIQDLCALYDEPLALTSANLSAEPSSLNIIEFQELWSKLGGIFDAGQIGLTEERRSASTVVDLTVPGHYKIVREGVALKDTLQVLQQFGLKSIEYT